MLDFWLEKGVDGFRLDVAGTFLHDAGLTDNPPVPMAERRGYNWSHAGNLQRHLHDSNLPENVETLDVIRRRVEAHGDRFVFGEFSEEEERCGAYLSPTEGLHSAYTFVLLLARKLTAGLRPRPLRDAGAPIPATGRRSRFSNHDVPRTVSRFGGDDASPELAKLLFALLVSLKGTTLIYQGEELGLPQAALRARPAARSGGRPLLALCRRPRRLPHADAVEPGPDARLHHRRALAARRGRARRPDRRGPDRRRRLHARPSPAR